MMNEAVFSVKVGGTGTGGSSRLNGCTIWPVTTAEFAAGDIVSWKLAKWLSSLS